MSINSLSKALALVAILITGCSRQIPEIEAVCDLDSVGNYIIKWEVSPKLNGIVRVFASDDPDVTKGTFVGQANINDGVMKYISHESFVRKYFRLVFDSSFEKIISSRVVSMDYIPNFRDIGGYVNRDGQMVRWGKVYRSGTLGHISSWDSVRLSNLKIKTIVDMRTDGEASTNPVVFPTVRIVSVPVVTSTDYVIRQALGGKFRKGDVSLHIQDMYLQFTDNTNAFSQLLSIFSSEAAYPILISDSQGKDCTGYLSALLLSALDVSEKRIFADYVDVNESFNSKFFPFLSDRIDIKAEEALSTALFVDESFLELAFRKIKKENGSVADYMKEELLMNDARRDEIRRVLLK